MAFIKRSLEKIISVQDGNTTESIEETAISENLLSVLCKQCGIQHLLAKNEVRLCCNQLVK